MSHPRRYVSAQLVKMICLYLLHEAEDDFIDFTAVPGLDGMDFNDGSSKIDIDVFSEVLSVVVARTRGVRTGLRMAEGIHRSFNMNLILMGIMANCPTVERAIEKLIRYHDISSNAIRLVFERHASHVALIWKLAGQFQPGLGESLLEAAMASCYMMLKDITMGKLRLDEVRMCHEACDDIDEYQRVFGCHVVFGAGQNMVLMSNSELILPIRLSDSELLGALEHHAQSMLAESSDRCRFSDNVADLVGQMIVHGIDHTLSHVARRLTMSTRALQEKLKSEGTTFRKTVDQVKREIAEKSLQDPYVILADTAFLLGFSEQSAFNQAFRRWTGKTPREYRAERA